MAVYFVDGLPLLTYNDEARDKYWGQLSQYIIEKYGNHHFTKHEDVESILIDGFDFLVGKFKELILGTKSLKFFLYTFWLHENSIKIYVKILKGYRLEVIDENEFSKYRRVLKLILEQGCDIDFEWDEFPNAEQQEEYNRIIQELLYLGMWLYEFADLIAFHKMIYECHDVKFENNGSLVIDWRYHFGRAYHNLFPSLSSGYAEGVFDENAAREFISKIEESFGIEYNFAGGIIFKIKEHHRPHDPTLQTIQRDILSENLVNAFGITKENADMFYDGLSISRHNKLSVEDSILKPYSTKRHMFRPILVYNINGEERLLVGQEKFTESIMVISTNALHWKAMVDEWSVNERIKNFMNQKSHVHDTILEDSIQEIIENNSLPYCRNVKSFKRHRKNNLRFDNQLAGEIDFIIVNIKQRRILVGEAKYNRARYEGVGFRNDLSNFKSIYEPKLLRKVEFIQNNLMALQEHLEITGQLKDIDLQDFEVEGIFLINTPTFYMFNGDFKAYTLSKLSDFFDGKIVYPELPLKYIVDGNEISVKVGHPYFRKPE